MTQLTQAQLGWRCRRGVRELDVLFGRFVDSTYPQLDPAQQDAFARLLDEQDPVIMDWLFGKSTPSDPTFIELVEILRQQSGLDR